MGLPSGRAPCGRPEHDDQARQIGLEASHAARQAIEAVKPLFPDASLDGIGYAEARRLSWLLCGFTVQADWIGSNPDWFPPQDTRATIESYWEGALVWARAAIASAGLHGARPVADGDLRVLAAGVEPRPTQVAVADVVLPDGPALALIEDATSAGKTEAALILAARMIAEGKGDGLFLALPTMAMSDAMLARLESIVPRLLDGRPSLALTHVRARKNDLFREIRGRDGSDQGGGVNCG